MRRLLLSCAICVAAAPAALAQRANTLAELSAAISRCIASRESPALPTVTGATVRFALRRDGSVLGEPRVAFVNRDADPRFRDLFAASLAALIRSCAPFAITDSLGGAFAGRPITLRIFVNPNGKPGLSA